MFARSWYIMFFKKILSENIFPRNFILKYKKIPKVIKRVTTLLLGLANNMYSEQSGLQFHQAM